MSQLTKIGIIGAGTIGSGIAQKIAQENIPVVMVDVKPEFVAKGLNNIKTTVDEGVQKKIFTPDKAQKILANVKGTVDMKEISDADLVVEAVFEDKQVKSDLFRQLDKVCSPRTVFASNTSSYYISELARATQRPDRFVGLHYFYHPAKNRLLEIIPGAATSRETIELAEDFANQTGKTAILVKDAPGFAVNRFFVPWLNEAARILAEGVANIATIDEAAKRQFKIGMGPFMLMNVTGIPIAFHSTETLGRELGKFYATSDKLKTQFESKNTWDLAGAVDESKLDTIGERLLAVVCLVACQLVDEGVARLEDIDRGAKIGLRWAFGPFELMNKIGLNKTRAMIERLCVQYQLPVPAVLVKQGDRPWTFKLIDLNIDNNIATIAINRPEAMNSLNEEVVRQLDEVFRQADGDPNVKAIVLAGKGKAFVAGADIGFFVKKIKDNKIGDIVEFTRRGQELLSRIDKSRKLVIAKVNGLALGGGAELALACDIILMTERASLGFPETGIGIYPGLGGTQRLPRLIGNALARYLIFTGDIISGRQASEMDLAQYVASTEVNALIKELAGVPDPKSRLLKTIVIPAQVDKIRSLFTDEKIDAAMSGHLLQSAEPLEAQIGKKLSFKAPLALKAAAQLINDGLKGTLEQGLELELKGLPGIFLTQDALAGLTSVLERKRPVFRGA